MQSIQHLKPIWYFDSNQLSPIPEIPNSATISPELSPEPVGLTSQSTKILPSNPKIKRLKKPEKRDLNIRIEKRPQKPKILKKKPEIQTSDLDSLDIYRKNKKEFLKIIPETTKDKYKAGIYKSPERPETSRIITKISSKRSSVPRFNEETKVVPDKLPKISSRKHEIKLSPVKKGKNTVSEALLSVKQKRDFSKAFDEASNEVQKITMFMCKKALK